MSNRLFILDAMNLAHKCYFVHKSLMTSQGEYSGLVYGAKNFMSDVLSEMEPTHFLVVTDAPGKTFRHDMYDGYKANRSAKDPEFLMQLQNYYDMFKYMGINVIDCPYYEADDVIGSAVEKFKSQIDTFILSGDKDFIQLLGDDNVKLCWTNDLPIGVPEAKAKLGIHPNQMVDYLALMGDSADCVPGVKGVGPKKASALLNEFQTLDGIYNNMANIKGKALLENLTKGKDNAYLSKSLVEIKKDIEIPYTLDELKLPSNPMRNPQVMSLFKFLEFNIGIGV